MKGSDRNDLKTSAALICSMCSPDNKPSPTNQVRPLQAVFSLLLSCSTPHLLWCCFRPLNSANASLSWHSYFLPDQVCCWALHMVLPVTSIMTCCITCHADPQLTVCLSPGQLSPLQSSSQKTDLQTLRAQPSTAVLGVPKTTGQNVPKF